jgi:predicted nucleic acid-binding protein
VSYLLDTSIVSQSGKPVPNQAVMQWWSQRTIAELKISSIVILEFRYGFELLPAGRRRRYLEAWLEQTVLPGFQGRIIPIDERIADLGGKLLASSKMSGHTAETADALIAATAIVHGLKLATLNRKHFERLGVEMVTF